MTDNGLAALTVAFFDLTWKRFAAAGLPTRPFEWDHLSDADREKALSDTSELLGPRGVFLPDGLGPVMVGMAKEIAALRAALDVHHAFLLNGVQECGLCKRAALAEAEEMP